MRTAIVILLALAKLPFAGYAQKPAHPMSVPRMWEEVEYDHQLNKFYLDKSEPQSEFYWTVPSGPSSSDILWRVFADRKGVTIYSKAGSDGQPVRTLELGERLYVFKEAGEWVQVGAERTKAIPEGWCNKKELLLWYTPLVDGRTRIELKAFLVNTSDAVQDIRSGNKQKYSVYDGPTAEAKLLKDEFLYDVLYIYKWHKDGNTMRWLVGMHPALDSDKRPMGWVNQSKVKVWSTRLCLEPNPDAAAVQERKARNIKAKVFSDQQPDGAKRYLETGTGQGMSEGEESDPAFRTDPLLGHRMDSRLFRYPVFDGNSANFAPGNCSFLTGMTGRITIGAGAVMEGFSNEDYIKARRAFDAMREYKDNVNVVFVIEGGAGMAEHMKLAKDALSGIHAANKETGALRYGAVVYKNELAGADAGKDPESNYLEAKKLTSAGDELLNWLDDRANTPAGDPVDARVVYFALRRALDMLPANETNIVVHLSRRPDNGRMDEFFSGKTLLEATRLGEGLGMNKGLHYLGYVTKGQADNLADDKRQMAFEGLRDDVIQNLSAAMSNADKGLQGFGSQQRLVAQAPKLTEEKAEDGDPVVRMDRFHFMMKARKLLQPEPILARIITEDAGACIKLSKEAWKAFESVVVDDSDIKDQAMDLSYFGDELLAGLPDGDREEVLRYLAANKVHVFQNGVAYWKPADLKEPVFRYVLFYEKSKLDQEVKALDKIIGILDGGNKEEARTAFAELWKEHAEAALGTKYSDKVTLEEVRGRLMGIHEMRIVKPFTEAYVLKGITLADIKNPSKFKLEDMDKYKQVVQGNLARMKELLGQGAYEVPGVSDRKFYWVPIEFLFN